MFIQYKNNICLSFTLIFLVLVVSACGGSSSVSSTEGDCKSSIIDECGSQDPAPEPNQEMVDAPDVFLFNPKHDVAPGSFVTSELVTISGIDTTLPISIEGGEYAINEGTFTDTSSTVENGDSLQVRLIASSKRNWTDKAALTVGDYSTVFKTVTKLPQIGVNLNGAIQNYTGKTKETIDQLNSEWARGFLDYFFFFDDDPTPPYRLNNSPKLSNIAELKAQGYKIIINIKWGFKNPDRNMPDPDEAIMDTYKSNLSELYDRFWRHADIIVVGNEPIIESPGNAPSNAPNLERFYEQMLQATVAYRAGSEKKNMPIYLGAFNRLDDVAFQSASDGLLELARATPEVEGVDLHIHHIDSDFGEMKRSIEYALDRIRSDQKIISTEFSAMRYYKQHTSDQIDAEFAGAYGIDPNWEVHEYLNDLLARQASGAGISRQQWIDFVTAHPWYDSMLNDYFSKAFDVFMDTASGQFELATYGVWQQFGAQQIFDENTSPWILNGIILSRTVRKNADGTFSFNKYLHKDFDLWR
ncbi:hypothetical protein EDC38_2341 [Marinimicrobium koreense]|uniref:Uncharacterized protein n=1 Tax=Marinimicrobium koreense TaxID=306545 RepID=A0A3N1NPM7_9GAMM|nr:hypothetical protein [Marinimicrobium koreense]ROQ21714.1 hypothetical protein EDC38_2341 [Marinimicrobium koreense]